MEVNHKSTIATKEMLSSFQSDIAQNGNFLERDISFFLFIPSCEEPTEGKVNIQREEIKL